MKIRIKERSIKYLKMARSGTTKCLSNKHEKYIADVFGGRVQIASGALWFASSDVDTKKYLIECKATENSYYILKKSILDKIHSEAYKVGKIPLLCIRTKRFGFYADWVCFELDNCSITKFEEIIVEEFDKSIKIDPYKITNYKVVSSNRMYVIMELSDFMAYFEEEMY